MGNISVLVSETKVPMVCTAKLEMSRAVLLCMRDTVHFGEGRHWIIYIMIS